MKYNRLHFAEMFILFCNTNNLKKKKLCNMRGKLIPIFIGALRTVPSYLEKEHEELEINRRIYSTLKWDS